jgi:hypothetical protein
MPHGWEKYPPGRDEQHVARFLSFNWIWANSAYFVLGTVIFTQLTIHLKAIPVNLGKKSSCVSQAFRLTFQI